MRATVSAAAHPARLVGRLATPAVALVLVVVTAACMVATIPLAREARLSSGVGGGFLLVLVGFLVVGYILVRQRPLNPIGWSMVLAAFFGALTGVAGPYVVAAYRLHDHLPLPQVAVFLQPSWAPAIFLFTLAVMLFPDGTLPSGRWRWAMGTLACG